MPRADDNQIKLGGRRVEIGEIESSLRKFFHWANVVVPQVIHMES